MRPVKASIVIDASPEVVFDFRNDLSRMEAEGRLLDRRDLPNGGVWIRFQRLINGKVTVLEGEDLEFQRPHLQVGRTTLPSRVVYTRSTYEALGAATTLTLFESIRARRFGLDSIYLALIRAERSSTLAYQAAFTKAMIEGTPAPTPPDHAASVRLKLAFIGVPVVLLLGLPGIWVGSLLAQRYGVGAVQVLFYLVFVFAVVELAARQRAKIRSQSTVAKALARVAGLAMMICLVGAMAAASASGVAPIGRVWPYVVVVGGPTVALILAMPYLQRRRRRAVPFKPSPPGAPLPRPPIQSEVMPGDGSTGVTSE